MNEKSAFYYFCSGIFITFIADSPSHFIAEKISVQVPMEIVVD